MAYFPRNKFSGYCIYNHVEEDQDFSILIKTPFHMSTKFKVN